MARKRSPQTVASSLQRALAEDRERTRTKSQVEYTDLNDGRPSTRALPYLVITPELRKQRGWAPHQPASATAHEARVPPEVAAR